MQYTTGTQALFPPLKYRWKWNQYPRNTTQLWKSLCSIQDSTKAIAYPSIFTKNTSSPTPFAVIILWPYEATSFQRGLHRLLLRMSDHLLSREAITDVDRKQLCARKGWNGGQIHLSLNTTGYTQGKISAYKYKPWFLRSVKGFIRRSVADVAFEVDLLRDLRWCGNARITTLLISHEWTFVIENECKKWIYPEQRVQILLYANWAQGQTSGREIYPNIIVFAF